MMKLPPGARNVRYIAFSFPEEIPADLLKFIYDATFITLIVDGREIAAASMFKCKADPPHSRRFVWKCEAQIPQGSGQLRLFLKRHHSDQAARPDWTSRGGQGFFVIAEICIDGLMETTELSFERREPARHINN